MPHRSQVVIAGVQPADCSIYFCGIDSRQSTNGYIKPQRRFAAESQTHIVGVEIGYRSAKPPRQPHALVHPLQSRCPESHVTKSAIRAFRKMARKNHTVKEITHHFPTVKIEQDIAHQSRIFCLQNQIGGTDSHARGIDIHTHFIDSQPRAFRGHKTVYPTGHIVLVDPHIAHPGIYVGPFLMLDIHTSVVAWARPDFAVAVKVVTVRNVVHYQVVDQDLEFHRLACFFLGRVGRSKIINNKLQI